MADRAPLAPPPADPRQRLLDAAARVVARRGVDQARYSDVARETGVSVGSIQHYFEDRADLFTSTFAAFNEKTVAAARETYETAPGPRERLVGLIRFCVDGPEGFDFQTMWSVWLEHWSASNRDADLRRAGGDIYRAWRRPFRAAIEDGLESGAFTTSAPVEDVVDVLIGCIEGLAIRTLLEPDRMSRERMLDLLLALAGSELGTSLAAASETP